LLLIVFAKLILFSVNHPPWRISKQRSGFDFSSNAVDDSLWRPYFFNEHQCLPKLNCRYAAISA
jgi:hypothetical protein